MQRNISSRLIASVSTPEDEHVESEMQALMRAEQEKIEKRQRAEQETTYRIFQHLGCEPGQWEYKPVEYSPVEYPAENPSRMSSSLWTSNRMILWLRNPVRRLRSRAATSVQCNHQLVYVQPQLYKISPPGPECMQSEGERLSPPHFIGKDGHCRRRTPAEIRNKGKG